MSHRQNADAESNDDQWEALKQQLFDDDDSDTELQASGDLHLPQTPGTNKKSAPAKASSSQAKKTKPAQKAPKAKQKTLTESLNEADFTRALQEGRANDEDNDFVGEDEILKHLQDDSSDDDDEDGGPETNANDFFAVLTNTLTEPLASEYPSRVDTAVAEARRPPPVQTTPDVQVTLEDVKFTFEAPSPSKKTQGIHTAAVPAPGSTKETYLKTERKTEAIQMSSVLQPETVAVVKQEPVVLGAQAEGLFYWLDAKEQTHTAAVEAGSIFLFGRLAVENNGKTSYRSCCVRVQDACRCIYLLPKAGSKDTDVLKELNEVCRNQGIEKRRMKFVERYYAFEDPSIPQGKSRWVKLQYPGRFPALKKVNFEHMDHMMGAFTSLLETFLVKRKMKGPSFLRMKGLKPVTQRVSHCDLEFTIDSPKMITVDDTPTLRPPPLTLASIQLHAQLDEKGASNEVFVASVAVYRDVNVDGALKQTPDNVFTGIRSFQGTVLPIELPIECRKQGLPGVQCFQNEALLLRWLATRIRDIDPDMLVGHNFLGYTLATLLRRYQEFDTPGWSSLGRLDHKRLPRLHSTSSVYQEKEVCVGRLVIDSYLLSREYFKAVDYKLTSLAKEMNVQGLVQGDSQFEPGNSILTPEMLASKQQLFSVLAQVCNCTALSCGLAAHLDVIRLTKRLTSIAGNLWSRTLAGARSERVEYLLLHTFHGLKFINPDKKTFDQKRSREDNDGEVDGGKRKAKYQGGMVLEPKCGLYSDFILLLDFNSLYPSLIQEFNICFTTVDRQGKETSDIPPPESLLCTDCAAAGLPSPCLHKCVLPKVIKSLVDSRREVKRLMKSEKDPNNLALLEIRQKALKITANSMYGCLGFEHSRFYAQQLAELVTRQGRLALQNTVDLIPQINPSLRVIYGDTDSVMIQTGIKSDIKSVRELGYEVRAKVNKRYQCLEIDIDGIFRAILLLKKKKYAALSVEDWQTEGQVIKREVKGLDMVRRDWCPLSKKVSDIVLSRILYAEGSEDVLDYIMQYMHDVAEHVRRGDRYQLEEFVISKSLTKEPEAYRGSAFPHATVALRMKQHKKLVRIGDLIPYVICAGDKLSDKAYHVEEAQQQSLHLDAEWYLTSQLYPPVMRLCEQIQGFSAAQLSEAMGIAHHESVRAEAEEDAVNDFNYSGMFKSRDLSECFPSAVKLQVQCTHCFVKTPIDPHQRVEQVLAGTSPEELFDLYVCNSCHRSLPVTYVANCFTQMCYNLLRQFYENGGGPQQVRAIRVQFTYFRALFDVPHAPGCPSRVKYCHRSLARRCLGIDRNLYTLDQAANPVIAEKHEPVDPLLASADTFYKRIENMFVNLDALFTV